MAVLEGQFQELEKRIAAFKFVFGRLQTSYGFPVNAEPFGTTHAIYLDSLVNGKINVANGAGDADANILPARTRTWIKGTHTGTALDTDTNSSDDLWAGSFETTTPNPGDAGGYDPATNPNVEKVIIPLIKMGQTNNQAYFAYEFQGDEIGEAFIVSELAPIGSSSQPIPDYNSDELSSFRAYNSVISRGKFFNLDSRRLKQFIDPVRFGGNYTVKIFGSAEDRTTFDSNVEIGATDVFPLLDAPPQFAFQQRGGWIFDYNQGMLYIAPEIAQNIGTEYPYMPGIRHPLWLVGYRYIGPTGSNMTVTSAGSAGSAGGGGGVSTTLVSIADGLPGAYDTDAFGWYDKNTLTATDSEDIIEYVASDEKLLISSSIGDQNLVVRLDSSSYSTITRSTWGFYQANDGDVYNGGDLFKFNEEEFPDYGSFAMFRTTGSAVENGNTRFYDANWITQSFEFPSPIRLAQIALCYSNRDNVNIGAEPAQARSTFYAYPAAYKLEGSTDNITFTNIATVEGIRTKTLEGMVPGPRGVGNLNSFGATQNSQYYATGPDENFNFAGPVRIYCATGSINDSTRYQYYRLYVSGGLSGSGDNGENVMALHHVDLWQNLDFGPTNRKQLHVTFNNNPSDVQSPQTGETLTIAEKFVSASMTKIGFSHFTPAGIVAFTDGEITGDITFPNTSHIQGVGQITASIVSASTELITGNITAAGNITAVSMSGVGDGITFNNISIQDSISTSNLSVAGNFSAGSNIILTQDNAIFLTNVQQNGDPGVDEFSAKIFGNYNEAGGVSDMYMDAYRIYKIADAKIDLRTLHPTLGQIVLQTAQTHISGALKVDNGMQISGSIRISGSIIPDVTPGTLTSSFDLGSSTAAWHDIHISDGTIRLYDGAQEKATIGLAEEGGRTIVEFKSGNEFQDIKAGTVDFNPAGTISTVQISNDAGNGAGFIAVKDPHGKNSTIFRGESTVSPVERMGTITQKGTGSFGILLDADHIAGDGHPDAKFVVESNNVFPGIGQRLFSVSESFETRVHDGGLRADNYVITTNITASNGITANTITANNFTGVFVGALSSSAQIADNISGSFNTLSGSVHTRLSNLEAGSTSKTLLSGSAQIASAISGAFAPLSSSVSTRVTSLEIDVSNNLAQITASVEELQTPFSSSVVARIDVLESNGVFTANEISGAFDQSSGSIESRLTTLSSKLQPVLSATSSYAIINNNVLFKNITASNNISASNITSNTISASLLHTSIFNPAKITTTEFTASLVNLGDLSNTRTFTTDHYNILFAASTRPALTIRNTGGSDITYFGSPVDNADAFIKFQADRSNTTFAMGIDSHDGTFKIAEGTYLNENSGFAPFSIKNNKVAILQSNDPAYPLDVAGDIRSTGTMRVDTIQGQTFPYTSIVLESNVTTSLSISSSATITANAFVGDGTGLTGIATVGSVVLNSATASFITTTTTIDGGTF